MTNVSYRGNAPAMKRRHRRSPEDHVLERVRRPAARRLGFNPAARCVNGQARGTSSQCSDRRRVRFSGLQCGDLERLGSAGQHPRDIVDKVAGEIGRAVKDPQFATPSRPPARSHSATHQMSSPP